MSLLDILAQINAQPLPAPRADSGALATIVNIVFSVAGSVALLMIVIGGFRYILAHGDPNSVSQAKKTILYAIIGLLVVMAAYAIVAFVVKGVV